MVAPLSPATLSPCATLRPGYNVVAGAGLPALRLLSSLVAVAATVPRILIPPTRTRGSACRRLDRRRVEGAANRFNIAPLPARQHGRSGPCRLGWHAHGTWMIVEPNAGDRGPRHSEFSATASRRCPRTPGVAVRRTSRRRASGRRSPDPRRRRDWRSDPGSAVRGRDRLKDAPLQRWRAKIRRSISGGRRARLLRG